MHKYNQPNKKRIRKILELRDKIQGENTFDRDEEWEKSYKDPWTELTSDEVNHPAHYTGGKAEAIDVIEDAIKNADDPVEGMLQGQALKYLLRMWLKGSCIEDAKKAQWYLNRLVDKLTASEEQ